MQPGLDDFALFAAVARTRNFRRAAVELGMSASALSQRLRDLEARLGVRLLNRTTRSVAPTEAGERLLRRLLPALRESEDAALEVRGLREVPSGRLRINGPEPAVRLVLAPMVAPFLARYPEVALEIVTDSSLIDIVSEGFDAGIRYEENLAQDMVAVALGPPERYVLVASPAFLRKHKAPSTPRDLVGAPCLVTRFRSGRVLPWEFRRGSREYRIVPTGPLTASHPELMLRAALDGLGFLMTLEGYAQAAIAAGRLVALLPAWCPYAAGPFLYYPGHRQPPPALAAFVAFVEGVAGAGGWPPPTKKRRIVDRRRFVIHVTTAHSGKRTLRRRMPSRRRVRGARQSPRCTSASTASSACCTPTSPAAVKRSPSRWAASIPLRLPSCSASARRCRARWRSGSRTTGARRSTATTHPPTTRDRRWTAARPTTPRTAPSRT